MVTGCGTCACVSATACLPCCSAADPNIQSYQFDGRWYTLFPERVTFSEANRTCINLPGEDSSLAVLPSRALLNNIGRRWVESAYDLAQSQSYASFRMKSALHCSLCLLSTAAA